MIGSRSAILSEAVDHRKPMPTAIVALHGDGYEWNPKHSLDGGNTERMGKDSDHLR